MQLLTDLQKKKLKIVYYLFDLCSHKINYKNNKSKKLTDTFLI